MKTVATVTVLTCLTCGAPPAIAGSPEIERGWSLVRGDLDVFIDPAAGALRLEGRLVARLDHDDASPGPMLVMNARDRLLRFEEVAVPGASVAINVEIPELGDELGARVTYAVPKRRGDEVEIAFTCRSEKHGRQFVINESIALASWVEAWYPILPPREDGSLSAATQIAGTTTFHIPAGWHAVTNGGLVSSTTTETGTVEVWKTDRPLSRSFVAGPYRVLRESIDGMDVSLYLLSSNLPDPAANVRVLAQAMEAMEARWGPYPYPSYAIAEVPMNAGAFGASSEQGFIMVKPFLLQVPGGNLPLFAHEAAHAWWGNTVDTTDPGSLICSESMAQYGAVIAAEHVWGADGATEFLRFSRPGYIPDQCARGYFELWRRGQDKPLNDLVSGRDVDHTLSDAKGHWVLHMLRRRVGDEIFFATTRGLIDEFSGRRMNLDDVRARFVAAAPNMRLDRFFAQWLDRTGAPVLAHRWDVSGAGTTLTVIQMQDGEPFDLDLDVLVEDAGGASHRAQVHLSEREQTFRLPGSRAVSAVRLDPDHALLLWGPEFGDAPVAGLEDRVPPPLGATRANAYAGEYDVPGAGIVVSVTEEEGHVMLTLMGKTQRLVHTGEHRFRCVDGFIIFGVDGDRAASLVYVRDAGGTRRAVRRSVR